MTLLARYKWDKELKKVVQVEIDDIPTSQSAAVHQDSIDPIVSHATNEGKIFDSRSKYEAHLKENGFKVAGEKPNPFRVTPQMEEAQHRAMLDDIEQSYYDVKYDRVPFTEKEKQRQMEELRKCQTKLKAPR